MIDEDEIKEKQDYLRINILEKGYNTEDFMDYLKTIRGEEGLKIENWSKNDLVNAVYEFKRYNPLKKYQQNNDENPENQENEQIPQNNENEQNRENEQIPQNQEYQKNKENQENQDDYNNYNENNENSKDILRCKKSEKNEISNKNIIITVSSPQVIEATLFFKSYVTYLIETQPLKLKVRRRFSDFLWLHDILKSLYINCIIPPLVKKNYIMGIKIKDYISQKRMRVVEKFLQEIANHPLLKNCQIFYDFISIKDEKSFNLKKQAYSSVVQPKRVEEIKTLNGEKNISINKEKEATAGKINRISEVNIDIMKKITKEYKNLNLQIENVISKIKDIKSLWTELFEKNKSNCEEKKITDIYNSMSKFMDNWATMHEAQINLINLKIREYFRYIRNEYSSINDYYKSCEDKMNDYKKSNQKLTDTNEKSNQEKKGKDWGLTNIANKLTNKISNKLLFYKDKESTKEKINKQNLYGCFLNSLIEESEIITSLNVQRHTNNLVSFFKEISNTITTFNTSLNIIPNYPISN